MRPVDVGEPDTRLGERFTGEVDEVSLRRRARMRAAAPGRDKHHRDGEEDPLHDSIIAQAVRSGCRPDLYAEDLGLRRLAGGRILPCARGLARDRGAALRVPPHALTLALGLAR